MQIEIYLDDLKEYKKKEIIEALNGDVGNFDVCPIIVIEFKE